MAWFSGEALFWGSQARASSSGPRSPEALGAPLTFKASKVSGEHMVTPVGRHPAPLLCLPTPCLCRPHKPPCAPQSQHNASTDSLICQGIIQSWETEPRSTQDQDREQGTRLCARQLEPLTRETTKRTAPRKCLRMEQSSSPGWGRATVSMAKQEAKRTGLLTHTHAQPCVHIPTYM